MLAATRFKRTMHQTMKSQAQSAGKRQGAGTRLTLKDVGRAAGVSAQTVSCAMNGTGSVSDEVRARVRKIAEELGYTPNQSAKAMRTGRSQIIGLVIPDIRNPFFPELAHEIEKAAAAAGYAVLFVDTHGSASDAADRIASLKRHAVDGVIMKEHLPEVSRLGLPSVIIGDPVAGVDSITSDDVQGGVLIAEYLLKNGHRSVGLVTSPALGCVQERRSAFIERFNGTIEWEMYTPPSDEVTSEFCAALDLDRITAIVCSCDVIAVDVIRHLKGRGVNVPADVSMIGFDDIPWAKVVTPALTTIRQPYTELAKGAIKLLLSRMGNPDRRAKHVKLGVSLVERDTVSSIATGRNSRMDGRSALALLASDKA